MASGLGLPTITQCLIDFGCDVNSRTDLGDTALMICAKYKQEEYLNLQVQLPSHASGPMVFNKQWWM